MEWVTAINEAIEYMEENLLTNLPCEQIAAHVYLSSFHFQRTFQALTGMGISEYIRNRRLSLAGHELLSSNLKVIDIAYKYGYETPESFTKAFTRFHGISPVNAKRQGVTLKSFNRLSIKISLEGGSCIDYRIVEKEAFEVVALTRVFEGETFRTEIPAFWKYYFDKGLHNVACGALGICEEEMNYASRWRYGIGDFRENVQKVPEEFEVLQIPSYTWAIFTCKGPMPETIQNMWKRVYSEWLPQSKYELLMDYDLEYYTEGDTKSNDYVSEIWIPVKEKQRNEA